METLNNNWFPSSIHTYDESDIEAVTETLKNNALSIHTGTKIKEFENLLAQYHGTKYALSTNSGTSALHMALSSLGIGIGDEVILPGFSFIATAQVILHNLAIPVFVDIDPNNFNIDIDAIESSITSRTKAIIVVHLFGNPVQMERVVEIAKRHSIYLIEDCSQAIGSVYRNKRVGTFGDIGCFSFNEMKNLTTGEGGAIITNSDNIHKHIARMRHAGLLNDLSFSIGHKFLMTEIQAALGISQLSKLDNRNEWRYCLGNRLRDKLRNCEELCFQSMPQDSFHCNHRFVFRVLRKSGIELKKFQLKLNQQGAMLRPVYPIPLYKHPVFKSIGKKEGGIEIRNYLKANLGLIPDYNALRLPNVEEFCLEQIGFNLTHLFKSEQIDRLGELILRVLNNCK